MPSWLRAMRPVDRVRSLLDEARWRQYARSQTVIFYGRPLHADASGDTDAA